MILLYSCLCTLTVFEDKANLFNTLLGEQSWKGNSEEESEVRQEKSETNVRCFATDLAMWNHYILY
jgi:hypothetical protein